MTGKYYVLCPKRVMVLKEICAGDSFLDASPIVYVRRSHLVDPYYGVINTRT